MTRPRQWYVIPCIALILTLHAFPGFAADADVVALRQEIASLTALVTKLSARVDELETAQSLGSEMAATRMPAPARPVAAAVPGSGAVQNANPDISVAGIALGKWTTDKRDPDRNTFGLDESEIVFSKSVSPYSRANLTVGFHGEHVHVEEGFLDLVHLLPGKLEARVGKFLVPAGYLNTIHPHDWPMVAKPRSLEYMTGDEHFSERGLSLSMPIDLRSKTYLKANVDVLHGDNATLFNAGQTRVYGGRVTTNTPLNDRDDLNVGANFHRGAWNKVGDLESDLFGLDLMWRRRFNQFDRFVLWGEWLWNRREQLDRASINARGYYVNALYKFKKDHNWHVGLEYDCSEKPGDARFNTVSRSAYLGYWLTENDRLQLQFRNTRDPFRAVTNDEVLFEIIWGMGPHKPHLANF